MTQPRSGAGPAAILAGALAAAAGTAYLVTPWEGIRLRPYQDLVGVWTVCAGVTRNVEQRQYSRAECDGLLRDEIGIHLAGVARCINRPLEQRHWVALGSWTYNVGIAAACRSSLVRKINAGAPPTDWCPDLLRWNRAGGKPVRGLTNRRKAELYVCLGGV